MPNYQYPAASGMIKEISIKTTITIVMILLILL